MKKTHLLGLIAILLCAVGYSPGTSAAIMKEKPEIHLVPAHASNAFITTCDIQTAMENYIVVSLRVTAILEDEIVVPNLPPGKSVTYNDASNRQKTSQAISTLKKNRMRNSK